uniref:Uncharacterized protein n=1 Tax=viral metagenome TaxID=1070528 RepID=A0A6M3J421_9ZZZZ
MLKINLPDGKLEDRLDQLENHIKIARLLVSQKREDLIPTALEDLHYDAQTIIDEYCVQE